MHASPDAVINLLMQTGIFSENLDLTNIVTSILQINKITSVEIVMGVAIILMARRFFSGTMNSLKCIFKTEVKNQPVLMQIFILAGEAMLIVLSAFGITFVSTLRAVRKLPIFQDLLTKFPILTSTITSAAYNALPVAFIFIVVFLFYKLGSRSNPPTFASAITAAFCTFVFWAFQKLMRFFINVNNYNFVYGTLSTIIVLLLEVWFFFIIFLYCAQFLFVYQYFDTLLLSELYVLPERDDTNLKQWLKRILFITPTSLLSQAGSTITIPKGQTIYTEGQPGTDVYYILNGTVLLMQTNNCQFLDKGDFFGEQACLLNSVRREETKAETDVELLKIDEDTFFEIIDKNRLVSQKALSKISLYFSRLYGRISNNVL